MRFYLVLFTVMLGAAVSSANETITTPTQSEIQSSAFPCFRLELRYPGTYRVSGGDLLEAGVGLMDIVPDQLRLTHRGRPVPLRKTASGDSFLIRDTIEFVAEGASVNRATNLTTNEADVYLLWVRGTTDPLQYRQDIPVSTGLPNTAFQSFSRRERDRQFQYTPLAEAETDGFFWLPHQAGADPKAMWKVFLTFSGFDSSLQQPVKLSARFYGATDVSGLKPTHKFGLHIGDYDAGTFSFDGMKMHDFHTSIPHTQVKPRGQLTLHTPPDRTDVVDRVFLDYIDVSYPRKLDAEGAEYFVFNNQLLNHDLPISGVQVKGLQPGSTIYDIGNARYYELGPTSTTIALAMDDKPTTYVAVAPNGRMKVDSIRYRDLGDSLATIDPDLETLVFSHPDVAVASDTYTRYRTSRGMKIKEVFVTDVFDALNQGFIDDAPLKQYVRYVAERAPKLRYIVLFGDSTFDYRESRTYDEENPPKVLIPIHWVSNPATTWSGGYQDDNWYGSLAEEYRPDLAVGRIPATGNEDGIEYVRKLIEYEELKLGKNDKSVYISSVEKNFQDLVTEVSKKYEDQFSTSTLIFPETATATQEVQRLRDEITSGVNMLYYVGHGGSMVWRVGPTDFAQQKDLFTPKEANLLTNWGHYPIIACSSCYTTSFDQQNSLGESLVLRPGGGAIALFGSPWKATVYESHSFNSKVFKYMYEEKVKRLGEAALLAHRELTPAGTTHASFQSFTLLGDPCLELQLR